MIYNSCLVLIWVIIWLLLKRSSVNFLMTTCEWVKTLHTHTWSFLTRSRSLPLFIWVFVGQQPCPSHPISSSSFLFLFSFAQLSICLHNCISSELYLLSLLSNQYVDDRRTPAVRYRSRRVRQIYLCQGPGRAPRLLGTHCAVGNSTLMETGRFGFV